MEDILWLEKRKAALAHPVVNKSDWIADYSTCDLLKSAFSWPSCAQILNTLHEFPKGTSQKSWCMPELKNHWFRLKKKKKKRNRKSRLTLAGHRVDRKGYALLWDALISLFQSKERRSHTQHTKPRWACVFAGSLAVDGGRWGRHLVRAHECKREKHQVIWREVTMSWERQSSNAHFKLFFFWPYRVACGMLVPWPGLKPGPLAMNAES